MTTTYITNSYKGKDASGLAFFALFFLTLLAFSSCKKQSISEDTPYSIKVFNGIDGAINLYGNYNGDRPTSFRSAIVAPNRTASISSNFLEVNINGSYFASPDTMPKDQPVFKQNFNLASSRINTLYLMGSKSDIDYLFVPQNFRRYIAGDSLTYLTFVNISNDLPVSINIKDRPAGSLISELGYTEVSEIIEMPVDKTNAAYEIEFRDFSTGDLLSTFFLDNSNPSVGYFSTYLYKNTSLVLVGKRGDTGADKVEVVRIKHDE